MNTTLIIMAAGIGSRYGKGIKQLAKSVLMTKSLWIIPFMMLLKLVLIKSFLLLEKTSKKNLKKTLLALKNTFKLNMFSKKLILFPEGCTVPEGRIKPWGTGQAILSCKGIVNEPFVIINADDYYGKVAFKSSMIF